MCTKLINDERGGHMDKFNEKYMLKQFINRNKYVETYKAIKSTSNEMVVLKVFNEDIEVDNLKNELRILKSMDNPNIININDEGSYVENEKVRHYLELESFSSKTLSDCLRTNTFDNDDAVKILKQIAEGLKEFHFENFIFENLNCDNICIYDNKIVKIDILSYLYEKISRKVDDEELSESNDIFSLGKILYELVSGKNNFRVGKCKDEISDKDLLLIIERCTNEKYKRYEDLNELITDLNSYIEYGGISSSFNNEYDDFEYEERNSNKRKYINIIKKFLIKS